MTLKATVEDLKCARDLTLCNPVTGELQLKEQLDGMNRDFVDTCESAIKFLSDNNFVYDRLFSILKYQWAITCEHDDKLTDKIERCEAALTTLHNLGFNLCTGEVNKE